MLERRGQEITTARRPKGFVEGLIYHVYNRARRGEAPFKLEDEVGRFWSLLHEVAVRGGA